MLSIFLVSSIGFAAKNEMDIYVNIVDNKQSTEIFATTEVSFSDAKTGKVLYTAKPNERTIVSAATFTIASKKISADKLLVKSKDATKYLTINRKIYRGQANINFDKTKKRLTVVNVLPLEEYLYGVVPQEMPHNWAKEALKAQIVAARTFARYNIGTRDTKGYDVDSTTNSQVYDGIAYENAAVNQLIDETRGEIITYKGDTIQAFFHSSAGGYTENAKNVWGTEIPYLKAVVDYDQKSTRYSWEKKFTAATLDKIFSAAGYKIGRIKSFEVSELKSPPMSVADRGVSGRVKELKIIGERGSVVVAGNRFRQLLKLDSTLFDIKVMKNNKLSKKISYDKGELIVISGRGFGHGLGLSQWGAKFMAENGSLETSKNKSNKNKKNNKDKSVTTKNETSLFYQKILKHYYTGVEIVKMY